MDREHVKVPGSLRLQVTQASFNEIVERDVKIVIIGPNTYKYMNNQVRVAIYEVMKARF